MSPTSKVSLSRSANTRRALFTSAFLAPAKSAIAAVGVALLCVLACTAAQANANAKAPQGYTEECAAHPEVPECGGPVAHADQRRTFTYSELRAVNDEVNAGIRYVPDMQHYGRPEVWEAPTDGKGVCHAYALAKLRALVAQGYPIADLRLAAGRLDGVWHVVLIARLDGVDYVLDSTYPRVMPVEARKSIAWSRIQSTGGSQDWVAYKGAV
jgi:predicted transglutaminase-like cysteine proteinase